MTVSSSKWVPALYAVFWKTLSSIKCFWDYSKYHKLSALSSFLKLREASSTYSSRQFLMRRCLMRRSSASSWRSKPKILCLLGVQTCWLRRNFIDFCCYCHTWWVSSLFKMCSHQWQFSQTNVVSFNCWRNHSHQSQLETSPKYCRSSMLFKERLTRMTKSLWMSSFSCWLTRSESSFCCKTSVPVFWMSVRPLFSKWLKTKSIQSARKSSMIVSRESK